MILDVDWTTSDDTAAFKYESRARGGRNMMQDVKEECAIERAIRERQRASVVHGGLDINRGKKSVLDIDRCNVVEAKQCLDCLCQDTRAAADVEHAAMARVPEASQVGQCDILIDRSTPRVERSMR